jgi:hypothetical protein
MIELWVDFGNVEGLICQMVEKMGFGGINSECSIYL